MLMYGYEYQYQKAKSKFQRAIVFLKFDFCAERVKSIDQKTMTARIVMIAATAMMMSIVRVSSLILLPHS